MKKRSFSYIELIFAMAVVIALIAMSAPLVSLRTKKETARGQGEFQCWLNEAGQYCSKQRQNAEVFSQEKCGTSCVFYRPKNVDSFEVTLIGAGAQGGKPSLASSMLMSKGLGSTDELPITGTALKNPLAGDTAVISDSDTCLTSEDGKYVYTYTDGTGLEFKFQVSGYKIVKEADAVSVVPGRGGYAGSVEVFSKTVKELFKGTDSDLLDKIEISAGSGYKLGNPESDAATAFSGKTAAGGQNPSDINEPELKTGNGDSIIVEGEPGMAATPSSAGGAGAKGGAKDEDFNAPNAKSLGGGGGGGAIEVTAKDNLGSKYTFTERTYIRYYGSDGKPLSSRYNVYIKGQVQPQNITVQAAKIGAGGQGGGGGVTIKW